MSGMIKGGDTARPIYWLILSHKLMNSMCYEPDIQVNLPVNEPSLGCFLENPLFQCQSFFERFPVAT